MCQPAPLARCSNHAQKAIAKLENDYDKLHSNMMDYSQGIVDKKRAAREDGVHSDEVMNENSTDPRVVEINKLRRSWEQAERDKNTVIRDIHEEELHIDATPKGLKALQENDDVSHRNLRIENAVAIRDWRKKLKSKNDSNGNPILSKDADAQERRTFLIQEFSAARNEQFEAETRSDYFNNELQSTYTKLSAYETNTELKRLGDGTRYTVTTLKPGTGTKEDAAEVEYLDVRKKELIRSINKANHDGILSRAKMNSVKTALKNDRKNSIKAKATANTQRNTVIEQNAIAKTYSEDLKRQHMTLVNESRNPNIEPNEALRLSAKASVVRDAEQRLDELRNRHGAYSGVRLFREEYVVKKSDVQRNEEQSKTETDKAMYRGARSGISLVLDKVRPI